MLDVFFWIAAIACIVAQFFILRAVIQAVPSVTGSPDVPRPNRAMEIAWAILPALLIAAVFIGAWQVLHREAPASIVLPTAANAPAGVRS
ncbi:MAG: hypothetical protein IT353_22720 [Gemmatimonadaceae bacterium]|nr:hypothetical protein [Gemmatimonadaceae bacterium]